jgi:ACT domain-containing protein
VNSDEQSARVYGSRSLKVKRITPMTHRRLDAETFTIHFPPLFMADQELIYAITRAVYKNLGAQTDERTVENLVMDVYRAVEPKLAAQNGASGTDSNQTKNPPGSAERLIVSVFGVDRPGIISTVSQILAEAGCSIMDINQTVVQGKFAMVLVATLTGARYTVAELKDRFRKEGERLGVRIYAQREDIFNAMHRL